MNKHIEFFFSQRDEKYAEFSAGLIPNIDKNIVIGVRLPILRKYAKELIKNGEYREFISSPEHTYHEENLLHAFIISYLKDYDEVISLTKEFLPHIDNWAVCDSFKPKCFAENKDSLYSEIKAWLSSSHTYTKRFAIVTLMDNFLGDDFLPEQINLVAKTQGEDYYLKMAKAWYFATALSKHYNEVISILEEKRLDDRTHNKTIQKAVESYRISDEVKAYLKTLKIK